MKKILIFGVMVVLLAAAFISWQFLWREKTVLFLCVRNSFRSQMAEAYFNKFAAGEKIKWQAKSAGFLETDKINEKAIILMAEEGINISNNKTKLLTDKMLRWARKIIVVCQECSKETEAETFCPVLPENKDIEYWSLPDPAKMELDEARKIRELVKEKVSDLIKRLK